MKCKLLKLLEDDKVYCELGSKMRSFVGSKLKMADTLQKFKSSITQAV